MPLPSLDMHLMMIMSLSFILEDFYSNYGQGSGASILGPKDPSVWRKHGVWCQRLPDAPKGVSAQWEGGGHHPFPAEVVHQTALGMGVVSPGPWGHRPLDSDRPGSWGPICPPFSHTSSLIDYSDRITTFTQIDALSLLLPPASLEIKKQQPPCVLLKRAK